MKKFIAALFAMVAITASFALASTAVGGPPTPIGIAEAKDAAKKYVHELCQNRNCRGSRVGKCVSKTQYRVDCKALYGRGQKDICRFTVIVRALQDKQLNITIKNVRCNDN